MNKQLLVQLRQETGAGMVDCTNALEEADGDIQKAVEILRKKGLKKVESKTGRSTNQGLIHAYIHGDGKVGVLVEVNCETDFVARNEEFKEFVHDIAMQIAASAPLYVRPEDVPQEALEKEREIYRQQLKIEGKPEQMIEKILDGKLQKYFSEACLLQQPFIKDDSQIIGDVLKAKIAKLGENIQVKQFCRMSL